MKKDFYASLNVNFVKFSLCKNLFTNFSYSIHICCLFYNHQFNICW